MATLPHCITPAEPDRSGRLTSKSEILRLFRLIAVGTALASALAVTVSGSANLAAASPAPSSSRSACTSSPRPGGWTDYRNGPANTGANTADSEIDPASVGALTPEWEKDKLVGVTGTPVVSAGVAYFGDETGTVWALTLSSGATRWSTKVGLPVIGSPATAGNALYVAAGSILYRLDAATGQVVWRVTTNPNPYSQINASPIVVGHRVILGTAQFEEVVGKPPETFQGSIGAWDTRSGKALWNFVTTPNDATSGAGEGIWSTPAVDTTLGLLYVGTGQNISQPTGRLADSLLALHVANGENRLVVPVHHPRRLRCGPIHRQGRRRRRLTQPMVLWWASPGRGRTEERRLPRARCQDRQESLARQAHTGQHVRRRPRFGRLPRRPVDCELQCRRPGVERNDQSVRRRCARSGANGKRIWSKPFAGNVFAPVTGVHGLAFVGTDAGRDYALHTTNGTKAWSYQPPAQVGGGAAIVGPYVLWGYGFTLFKGPGQGGIICFSVTGGGRVQQDAAGWCLPRCPRPPPRDAHDPRSSTMAALSMACLLIGPALAAD